MTTSTRDRRTGREAESRERAFRMSHQQRRAWQLSGGVPEAVGCAIAARGSGAADALRRGLETVVRRHGVLRTVFRSPPGVRLPLQWVQEEGAVAWSQDDGAGVPEAWLRDELAARPQVDAAPVLRARLESDGDGTAVLVLALPALSADAWTLARLPGEIAAALGSGEAGEPVQYPAFAAWQAELLEGQDEDAVEGRAFWTAAGAALPPPPARAARGPEPPHRVAVPVAPQVLRALAARDRAAGRSPDAGVRAAWHLLIARLAGEKESVVGTVLDGRGEPDMEELLGPVERRVPLRLEVGPRMSWEELAARADEWLERAREWEDFALAEVAGLPAAFAFGYRRLPAPPPATADGLRLELAALEPGLAGVGCELARSGDGGLELRLDPTRHGAGEAETLAARLARVLEDAAAAADRAADEAPVSLPEEEERTLARLDTVAGAAGSGGTAPDPVAAFVERAREHPQRPAVSGAGGSLFYGELERRSAALAHRLRAAGAGAESVVAIWGDPRPELLVAVLGVLRSGAAYLPLDPATPAERLRRMLEGLPVVTVVEVGEGAAFPVAGVPRLDLAGDGEDAGENAGEADTLPQPDPRSLAYLIFTSGSTGRPKPVGVERRQLAHYAAGLARRIEGAGGLTWGLVSSFAADLGHTALFPPLAGGGRVHLVSRQASRDPAAFGREMAAGEVEALKVVPSHLEALLAAAEPRRVLPRRLLVLGGEAWPSGLLATVRRAAPELALWNHYGPTETTVGATVHPLADGTRGTVPIGGPLPGVRALPLDGRLRIVPPGAPGELWIGGGGVARGYPGWPALTADRFRPDPWGDGDRLYRTGDRVRQLPDGNLEFLGRRDHQVKVRGHRVELGEVESVMAEHPGVVAAAAAVRPGPSGAPQLEGFYVPGQDGPQAEELRSFLARHLPEALVPTRLGALGALPRTAAGKVDRKALPDLSAQEGERTYVAPSGPVEETLAEIWSQVLGVDRVGAEDNFFALGGDSILVVQVIARAAAAGIGLTPRQFFEDQTVSGLARVAGEAGPVDGGGADPGPVPLLPAQRRFLEGRREVPRRWNWAVLLNPVELLEPARVERTARSMVARHDALRLRLLSGPEGWRQVLEPAPDERSAEDAAAPRPFTGVDLGALPPARRGGALEAAADAAQELDPARGGLLRVVLFELGDGAQRLFLAAHHLAVDGVSWRILLEELVLDTTGTGALPPATTPCARWVRELVEQVREGALDDEMDHWLGLSDVEPLPADGPGEGGGEVRLSETLEPEATTALLQEVPATYRVGMDEVLAAALALAAAEHWGRERLLVEWEGHGREELVPEADLTRTVGWFTSYYPVVLEAPSGDDAGAVLRAAKESLRRVPRRGAGLAPLRDFTVDEDLRRRLAALPRPELKLNYLGQADRVLSEDVPFRAAGESAGRVRGGAGHRSRPLELVARVSSGRLYLVWRHHGGRFSGDTVAALAAACRRALLRIVDHCRGRDAAVATPSDFPLAGDLDQEQLERILQRTSNPGDSRKENPS